MAKLGFTPRRRHIFIPNFDKNGEFDGTYTCQTCIREAEKA